MGLRWLKGAFLHDQVGISRAAGPDELRSTATNICRVRRAPPDALIGRPLAPAVTKAPTAATVLRERLEEAAELLVQDVHLPELQQAIHDDVILISKQLFDSLGPAVKGGLRAKLEVISQQSCPRWHADTVGIRCLCTYEGPGTMFAPNRRVRRHWAPDGGVAVLSVDESEAEQVDPWDLLYLKGNAFPGLFGMGAVHKSPEGASTEMPRLLLTVDDVLKNCSCCNPDEF